MCLLELKTSDKWCPEFSLDLYTVGTDSIGACAYQSDENTIRVRTATQYLFDMNSGIGDISKTTPSPCRVKVWKIGKIQN